MSTSSSSNIEIRLATLADVPSIATLHPRAFHPGNLWHQTVFPSTPLIRTWWSQIFTDEINSPETCHVWIAHNPHASSPSNSVVGIINLRLTSPEARTSGFWSMYPYTSDHCLELFQPAITAMEENGYKLFAAKGKGYFILELFGVDHEFKGTGLGKRLMMKALEFADEQGREVFVEADMGAKSFYEQFGFQCKGTVRIELPGEVGGVQEEFLEVRKVGGVE